MSSQSVYDVLVIGAGIQGTGKAFALSFTNASTLVIEKYRDVALVNSNTDQNAQTLHGGDTETNFTLEKALRMREAERLFAAFLEKFGEGAFMSIPKMALGIGQEEVNIIKKRFNVINSYYPTLQLLGRDDIARLEPMLVDGRDHKVEMAALNRENGYAVDYHKAAGCLKRESLRRSKQINYVFNTQVHEIMDDGNVYEVYTNKGVYRGRTLIVSAGSYSLKYARDLDAWDAKGEPARNFVTLPVAGSFYKTQKLINRKVYTVQDPKFPFAAPHADPAIHDPNILRFGPTAKWIPFWERHHWNTVIDYLRSGILTPVGIMNSFSLLNDLDMIKFLAKNIGYDLPIIGKRSFLKNAAQKIIPTLQLEDLEYIHGAGGLRPQPLNTRTGKLQMGTGKFFAPKATFNLTPSPGASSALIDGVIDTKYVVNCSDGKLWFDEAGFYEELGISPPDPLISLKGI